MDPSIAEGALSGQPADDRIERLIGAVAELTMSMNAIAEAILAGHGPPRDSPASSEGPAPDREVHAIAALVTLGPNVSAIAREVGVPRSTLYGWPKFMASLARCQQSAESFRGRIPRGSKSTDREVEAWSN